MAQETRHNFPIIQVTWVDSAAEFGWKKLAAVNKDEFSIIRSVGYLIRDDPKSVTISTSISDIDSCMDPLTIPKAAILKGYRKRRKRGRHGL